MNKCLKCLNCDDCVKDEMDYHDCGNRVETCDEYVENLCVTCKLYEYPWGCPDCYDDATNTCKYYKEREVK